MAEKKAVKAEKLNEQEPLAEARTTPNVRKEATRNRFAEEMTATLFDPENVPDEIHERNKVVVKDAAVRAGLRPVGEVKVESEKVLDNGKTAITYSVAVESL